MMRMVGPLLALGVALGLTSCSQTPEQRVRTQEANAAAAANLDEALAGLTPGRSATCMPRFPSTQVQAYGPTLVYTVNRGLKYRTDTAGGCERVGRGDILITRSPQGQTCQGDIATTVDSASRTFSGSCSFGPFVRYSRNGR
jgi:hypothetical protein